MSRSLELSTRRAPAPSSVSSWNEEARTVEVVWGAGADVVRSNYRDGRYVERLAMEGADLARLNAGASLLDSHAAWSMADRVGTVVPGTARIANGLGVATVVLLRTPGGEALADACRQGAGFLLSVGYKPEAIDIDEGDGSALPVHTVRKWTPFEISAVSVPADPAARTRNLERNAMENEDLLDAPVVTRTTPPPSRPSGEERRIAEIRALGARLRAHPSEIDTAIRTGVPLEDFRADALEKMIARQDATAGLSLSPSPGAGTDDVARLESEALIARTQPGRTIPDAARQYRGSSLLDIARRSLSRVHIDPRGLNATEVFARAMHSTSDFPTILGAAARTSLREAYEAAPSDLRRIAAATTHRDFRDHASLSFSGAPKLLKVNEHGEFKRGTLKEGSEAYAIATYGRIIGVTRQLLINDDLGAFTRIPALFARQAAALEVDLIAGVLAANPTMADGLALFSPGHANLAPAEPLSAGAVGRLRTMLRTQTDASNNRLNLVPRFLVVGSRLEYVAEQLLAAVNTSSRDDVVPDSIRKLELIVEPRLDDIGTGYAFYVAADPAAAPSIEYAYLEGQEGPHMETKDGWDVDGMEIKARLDFGVGTIDFRGLAMNPGAAV